jgi:hypothetical protein
MYLLVHTRKTNRSAAVPAHGHTKRAPLAARWGGRRGGASIDICSFLYPAYYLMRFLARLKYHAKFTMGR